MEALVGFRILVPGVIHEFLNLRQVLSVNVMDFLEVTVDDGTTRQLDGGVGEVVSNAREVAVAENVLARETTTVREPFRIEATDGLDVREVNVTNNALSLLSQVLHEVHRGLVDHRALSARFVHVDRAGHTADQVVRVRVLTAQNRLNLDDFALEF